MARKKAARATKRATKIVTRMHIATFVGLGLLTASAAAAAFGFASFSMSAMRPAVAIRTSAATPAAAIVLDDQTGVEIAQFDVITGSEAVIVETFSFQNCIARNDSDGDCADPEETSANLSQASLITVSYEDITGATITSSARPTANSVRFSGQTLYVPARSARTIMVYADTTTIDDKSVFSGDRFQINLSATSATFPFRALGQRSGRTYDESFVNRSVMSSTMALRNTKPTITLSSVSPSGAASAGLMELLRFNVAADSPNDVDVDRVTFEVATTDDGSSGWANCDTLGATTNFELINITVDPSTPMPATFRMYDTDGVSCGSGSNRLGYVEALLTETVPAGSTYTYGLWADTTGATGVSDDLLLVAIPDESSMEGGLQALTWQDGTARGTGITGRYVDALPIIGGMLTF